MKTFNVKYSNNQELNQFIENNNIAKNENILLQIFTGICDVEFIENLIQNIKSIIPHIHIIGTTTDGEIMDNTITSYSTTLSFSVFEDTSIAVHSSELEEDSYKTAQKLIDKFDKTLKPKVAISFVDGLHINGEAYMNAFNDYDNNLIVAGGLAGDNAEFKQTIVFTKDKVLTQGVVVALLYNDNLTVNANASFGWENIGKKMTITKSKDNIVYEIDHIKAVDIYIKYLGEDIEKHLPKTGIEFPLIIQRDGISIPRAVVGKNSDGSLLFAGNLNEGDIVTFGYGNIDAILSYGDVVYENINFHKPESIFIYSCMARRALMGADIKEEIIPLSKLSSVSGFFTYGEFYYRKSLKKHVLLNQTMTLLCICERNGEDFVEESDVNYEKQNKKYSSRESSLTYKALSHLISQTSRELEEMNNSLQDRVENAIKINKEQNKLMQQQSHMAQMGEMLRMIAHQWRQPLAAISATSASLELKASMGKLDNEMAQKYAHDISNFSQHLSSTIDDFRNFFKINKNKQEITYIEVIKSVLQIIETSIINKNINLIQDLRCKETFITYPNELKQVILNLIKNAEDALCEREIKDPYIKIHTYKEDDKYILEVRDNGGGVPEDMMEKVFDPYFSTKTKKDGTGLGLYMSKMIIEEHCGGELSVVNTEDGALFRVVLNKA